MKFQIITLALVSFLGFPVFGQVSSNTVTQSAGTFTNLTGGTVLWSATFDDNISSAITIPSFTFNCVAYTQLYVSSNGFISFGSAPASNTYTPISSSDGSGIVSAFGADLQEATTGTPEVRVQDLTASNEYVVQWRDIRRFGITGERITCQVRLNYATNVVRIVYGGTITANAATTPEIQVGIRGLTNADFNNRTTTTNWSATTAGGTNAATCRFAGTVKPAVAQTYAFTPAAMSYVSSTSIQSSTNGVEKCNAAQDILRVEIVTSGCTGPLSLTQIIFNMTGSTIPGTNTNDVSLIHVYYTGNSGTFSSSSPFDGAGTTVASGAITVNGSQVLTSGTNYFWIAYDMNNATSTIGNVVDAQCTSLTVGTVRTPTVTNPAGSRSIVACAGSPGGVSSGLSVWYKSDNTSSITMGTGVSSWNSSAGSAGTWPITQGTAAQQPGVISGATSPRLFNYNPRIDFVAASNTTLGNASTATDLMTSSGSYFIVSDNSVDDFTGMTYTSNLSAYRHQFKPGFRAQSSDASINGWTFDWVAPTEYSGLSACMTTVTGSGATMLTRKNSVALTASNSNDITYSPSISSGLYMGRNNSGGEDTDANIGEVILYSSTPSAANLNKIESYLAIKYGLTRGGNTGTTATYNYLSSNATTIWNKTTNSGFNFDIAGIGRDDASALIQKQSISVNNNEPVTVGLVSIASSNATNAASFSSDQSFLIWGNNGLLNQITTNPVCFANLPAGIYGHIERVWKGQLTNFAQNVTVGYETSMLVAYTPVSNLRLLVDNDGIDWTNATIYSGAVINGSRVEFSGVTISSATPFFTLASITSLTPLPVEITEFKAELNTSRTVDLTWVTESEFNCDYFTIEKSQNGSSWTSLGSLNGAGTTTETNTYELTDFSPFNGVNYYRLIQTDNNGAVNSLGIRSVNLDQEDYLVAYPNPVNGDLYLSFDKKGNHVIEFFDLSGRLILRKEIGQFSTIQMDDFAKGVYTIRTEQGKEIRIIVQ
ncbi:BNR-repeat neuraminidase N-terminal domain-containing protein [Fluviicola taffensis]|uniref:BNR-repeat neuraminidase N-terminal domain-containing protein n=1 Tax=Fluviicola taffensis TaxID=191579 RepID=UPI0031380358